MDAISLLGTVRLIVASLIVDHSKFPAPFALSDLFTGFAKSFSCRGILAALNWFHGKGHEVYVIVPQSRLDIEPSLQQPPCVDHHILIQASICLCVFVLVFLPRINKGFISRPGSFANKAV
jgi:hypothetical protein